MTLPQDQEGGLKLPANKVVMLSKKEEKKRKKEMLPHGGQSVNPKEDEASGEVTCST